MQTYQPGLHILSSFHADPKLLRDSSAFRSLVGQLTSELDMVQVGEVYHSFDSGGFTACVALTESHLAIHTWPEFGCATFDIFLSNYLRDNRERVVAFHGRVLDHFGAEKLQKTELMR